MGRSDFSSKQRAKIFLHFRSNRPANKLRTPSTPISHSLLVPLNGFSPLHQALLFNPRGARQQHHHHHLPLVPPSAASPPSSHPLHRRGPPPRPLVGIHSVSKAEERKIEGCGTETLSSMELEQAKREGSQLHEPNTTTTTTTISSTTRPKPTPKRFVKSQIPDSILNDPALNAAISVLPQNYNFEVHKCVWRVLSTGAKRVALQFPEGLLMYSLPLSDILTTFAAVDRCFVLADVTYGACCVDDFSAAALSADLLIHFGHSCLVPIDTTTLPCLYVFVDIKIDVQHLVDTVKLNLESRNNLVLAGTIQFASAIRAAKPELESLGFRVLVPQSKPLSAGEVLGCTAPKVPLDSSGDERVLVFVADGRFHLEAFMVANPGIKAFRYDPYMGKLFLEEYDHKGMKESRKGAILRARQEARNWGVVLGTLGRQGNPRILERLEKKMREKGFCYTVFLMSEISPGRIALFEDSVDAWIQIACPRLSIDWGDSFEKPVLNPFEAEIVLGLIPGWWEKKEKTTVVPNQGCEDGLCCKKREDSCCECSCGGAKERSDFGGDYPMDYYAQDGGEWNSSYLKKPSRPPRRISVSSVANGAISQES